MHYTVKRISDLTGIAPDRLRAWERRYGVVQPVRTDAGYRIYDDADLARLQMMAALVNEGTPASLAAQQVRLTHAAAESVHPALLHQPRALIAPASSLNSVELDHLLDAAFAADSFESVVEHWLLPALLLLGQAWADGRVDVAGEHFVSAAVRGRLSQAFEAAGTGRSGPVVLVGLPTGSHHELGALCFATCLRRRRVDVRWLGTDVPVDSWAYAVDRLTPAAVVLAVPTTADTEGFAAVVRRLRADHPALAIWAGGAGATPTDGAATVLARSVVAAADEVAATVHTVG